MDSTGFTYETGHNLVFFLNGRNVFDFMSKRGPLVKQPQSEAQSVDILKAQ